MSDMRAIDTSEIRDRLETDGFAILRDVVPRGMVASFSDFIDSEYDSFPKFRGGGMLSGHLNCYPGANSRFFFDAIRDAGLVRAISEFRGDRSNAVRATLNFNLPGSVAQHYHMDGLYTDDFVICNFAVVDTDTSNGAIDVLPGTHRQFYPFWKYAVQRKYRSSTRLPMRQGDVLVRRSNLWHRGMPNLSPHPRPMMSLTFGEASAPESDPFGEHDGEVVFYPNWYSTSQIGRLRERTSVAAPWLYSSYRFASSLWGNKGYSSY